MTAEEDDDDDEELQAAINLSLMPKGSLKFVYFKYV